jgi:hypothetical protein
MVVGGMVKVIWLLIRELIPPSVPMAPTPTSTLHGNHCGIRVVVAHLLLLWLLWFGFCWYLVLWLVLVVVSQMDTSWRIIWICRIIKKKILASFSPRQLQALLLNDNVDLLI